MQTIRYLGSFCQDNANGMIGEDVTHRIKKGMVEMEKVYLGVI